MDAKAKKLYVRSALVVATLVWGCTGCAQKVGDSPPSAAGAAEGTGAPGGAAEAPDEKGPPTLRSCVASMRCPPLPANAPQPSPNPRSFDGTWVHGFYGPRRPGGGFQLTADMFGYALPFTALGKKVAARRAKSFDAGTPYLNASVLCLPVGQPWQMDLNFPFQIFQSKDRFDFVFEEYHGLMEVVMDPAKALPPGYMGSSVGHWDGDTLVVETRAYKDGLWINPQGTPVSKDAKLTMRIRKVKSDHWYLEIEFTLDDPTYYTRPWSWMRDYTWMPTMTLFHEYDCELSTGAKGGIDPAQVPEPQN